MRWVSLFYYSLFEVLGEVGTDFHGGVFGGDFGHVGLDHEFDKLLEGGLVGVPTEFGLGLGGIAPKVDYVRGTVEIGGDADDDVSN